MSCNKLVRGECVGGKWCGLCDKHVYSDGWRHEMSEKEKFAFRCMEEFYKEYQEYVKLDKPEKSMSYYSCIQIMYRLLHE